MKFLRERFNKLCEVLGVDPDDFINEDQDRRLTALIASSANRTLKEDESHSTDPIVSESEYQESLQRGVEIHAAILIDRLIEMVSGTTAVRDLNPVLAFSRGSSVKREEAKHAWTFYIDALWLILEEIVATEPNHDQNTLTELIEAYAEEIEKKGAFVASILIPIRDNDKLRSSLAEMIAERDDLVNAVWLQALKDPEQKQEYEFIASRIYSTVNKYKNHEKTLEEVLKKLKHYYKKMLPFVADREQLRELIRAIGQSLQQIQKMEHELQTWEQTANQQYEDKANGYKVDAPMAAILANELLDEIVEDTLYPAIIPRLQHFISQQAELTQDQIANAQHELEQAATFLQVMDSLEGLCQAMRLIKINNVIDLINLGKDEFSARLQKAFFQRDIKKSLGVKSKLTGEDLSIDGNQQLFLQYLLPTVVYFALNSVADEDIELPELVANLGIERAAPELRTMQEQFARLMEWDFFVHHAEYLNLLANYHLAHGISEELKSTWQSGIMSELASKFEPISPTASSPVELGSRDETSTATFSPTTSTPAPTPGHTPGIDLVSKSVSPTEFVTENEASIEAEPMLPTPKHSAPDSQRKQFNIFRLSISRLLELLPRFRLKPASTKFTKPQSDTSSSRTERPGRRSPSN